MRFTILLELTALYMLPVSVFAAVLHVPGDYSTIQAGIDTVGSF